jgi:hypothetical protein
MASRSPSSSMRDRSMDNDPFLKNIAGGFAFFTEPLCVFRIERPHQFTERPFIQTQQKMIMIVHQDPRIAFKIAAR